MNIKHWIDCRIKGKHRYSVYTGKCIVCGKKDRKSSREADEKTSTTKIVRNVILGVIVAIIAAVGLFDHEQHVVTSYTDGQIKAVNTIENEDKPGLRVSADEVLRAHTVEDGSTVHAFYLNIPFAGEDLYIGGINNATN